LLKNFKTDINTAADITTKIFENRWSTGDLLFAGAGVCSLQNISPQASPVIYNSAPAPPTTAGFAFIKNSFPVINQWAEADPSGNTSLNIAI